MTKRLLAIISILTWCLLLSASPTDGEKAANAALEKVNGQIAQWQKEGDVKKEGDARWQKILTLKNFSYVNYMITEAEIQMKWFREHGQWDHYYRTWQLKANSLCTQEKLQLSLQETQRMLNDAKNRNNKLGRAMAYKQIGVIYLNMKQTEPAIEALQHYAELIKGEEDDYSLLSSIYYRMAKAYDYDKEYHKELKLTDEWLTFLQSKVGKIKKADVRECYNACYLARTAAFLGLNRFEDAKLALDTADHHAHLIKRTLSMHHFYKMKARYYLAVGDVSKALLYTDSVSTTTSEKDNHNEEVRAQALIRSGRCAEGAQIYQRLYHERDSVFSQEARQRLDELNTLFQVDELKAEQEHTKFLFMLLTAIFIVLALLLLLFYGWRTAIRQKKANEQLRIANEQAMVSSKMKTEFIRNISHEIRTPLNIVSGFTQILTAPDMSLPEEEKADIQRRVIENTDYITELVDRMLELSDMSSAAVIDCNDHIKVKDFVAESIERSRITLHTRLVQADSLVSFDFIDNVESASVSLRTNRQYAVRTLAQLLENAMKFTKKGNITLRIECTDTRVRFIVEDTGIGIPKEQSERIFDEFVQLNDFTIGTGIGLSVARSITRRMGGDLWLDTSYSKGSRFVLEMQRV